MVAAHREISDVYIYYWFSVYFCWRSPLSSSVEKRN